MLAHIHDSKCDCPNSMEHTIMLIFEQEKELKFTTPEKDLIKQCISGETTAVAATDHEPDDIGDVDLTDLFKEDFGEEDTAG